MITQSLELLAIIWWSNSPWLRLARIWGCCECNARPLSYLTYVSGALIRSKTRKLSSMHLLISSNSLSKCSGGDWCLANICFSSVTSLTINTINTHQTQARSNRFEWCFKLVWFSNRFIGKLGYTQNLAKLVWGKILDVGRMQTNWKQACRKISGFKPVWRVDGRLQHFSIKFRLQIWFFIRTILPFTYNRSTKLVDGVEINHQWLTKFWKTMGNL